MTKEELLQMELDVTMNNYWGHDLYKDLACTIDILLKILEKIEDVEKNTKEDITNWTDYSAGQIDAMQEIKKQIIERI